VLRLVWSSCRALESSSGRRESREPFSTKLLYFYEPEDLFLAQGRPNSTRSARKSIFNSDNQKENFHNKTWGKAVLIAVISRVAVEGKAEKTGQKPDYKLAHCWDGKKERSLSRCLYYYSNSIQVKSKSRFAWEFLSSIVSMCSRWDCDNGGRAIYD
jgi:hypothetical protein